jgi:hypothetical protein
MKYYILKISAAYMPSSCWGTYARIGLLELDGSGAAPAMISERARGVKRIVKTWEKLHVCRGQCSPKRRCAFHRAMLEAEEMLATLEGLAEAERGEGVDLEPEQVSRWATTGALPELEGNDR